ncbi:hypothetical protein Pyn_03680 [Prunus yedoensis var. nudiflora]|uniref:Uncharacterized protein n=1 Tax=Prunus yedoensis var. nudiflora TaxID=2094558 RepID=A0A314XQV5_PRUYE|nr:hypothetical protein Pyn_03680 [Prunus yedoensis var. nudiflora]
MPMRHNQEDLCWQSDDSSVTKASVSVSWVFNALNCPFTITAAGDNQELASCSPGLTERKTERHANLIRQKFCFSLIFRLNKRSPSDLKYLDCLGNQ